MGIPSPEHSYSKRTGPVTYVIPKNVVTTAVFTRLRNKAAEMLANKTSSMSCPSALSLTHAESVADVLL